MEYKYLNKIHESALNRKEKIESEDLPQSIGALLYESVKEVPEKKVLNFIDNKIELTYYDLLLKVEELATGMLNIGIVKGSRIAVMLPNIPEMPITWLALSLINAVMIPLNVKYTSYEIIWTINHCKAEKLIIHNDLSNLLTTEVIDNIYINNIYIVENQDLRFNSWSDLQDTKYKKNFQTNINQLNTVQNIQYTSGTTGMPKGCVLTQGYWLACAKSHGYCDDIKYDRILAANPYFYMTPQWLTLMTLMHRGCLYVAPYRSLSKYINWIKDNEIQFCLFPVEIDTYLKNKSIYKIDSMIRGNIYNHDRSKHQEMEKRFGFPLRTAFGMTEIGSGTYMPLDLKEMIGSGSCGISAPYRKCRIIDQNTGKVVIDQTGELEFKGDHMFMGYHNNLEATRNSKNNEWFKTGDLAYQDKYGFIYIVGRIKDMIRRSGENIAASEIEEITNKIEWVKESAALPVTDNLRGEEVKIYIVTDNQEKCAPDIVIEHCKKYLASFKIPRYIEYRNKPLPRTDGGNKIRKLILKKEKADLIEGCWDNNEKRWL